MHGNVFEWCWDAVEGSARVFRGGCWSGDTEKCQSSYRLGNLPAYRFDGIGFRVARGPQASQVSSGAESEGR
jgi:formylglycine-generating enzyme required for sulfatase activity